MREAVADETLRKNRQSLTPKTRININTAPAEELAKLPGIGEAIAEQNRRSP